MPPPYPLRAGRCTRRRARGGGRPGCANIPLSQLPARVGELDRGTPIVAVCRSGRRSQAAAEALAGAGFTVANLAGGMNRWTEEGHPTV
jgi:rhodanese-related sulfurtransferase